jgi:hypothetical protein
MPVAQAAVHGKMGPMGQKTDSVGQGCASNIQWLEEMIKHDSLFIGLKHFFLNQDSPDILDPAW